MYAPEDAFPSPSSRLLVPQKLQRPSQSFNRTHSCHRSSPHLKLIKDQFGWNIKGWNYKLKNDAKLTLGVLGLVFGYFLLFLTGAKESFSKDPTNRANLFNIKDQGYTELLAASTAHSVIAVEKSPFLIRFEPVLFGVPPT